MNDLPTSSPVDSQVTFDALTAILLRRRPQANIDYLRTAFLYSRELFGEGADHKTSPLLEHALGVAGQLAEHGLDRVTIAAGLLVDAIEQGGASVESLTKQFGGELAEIVEGVTRMGSLRFAGDVHLRADLFRKMIIAATKDIRVLIVRLADCCQHMRNLELRSDQDRIRISHEAMDLYAPLANRIGMDRIKMELEQLAFRQLEPEAYTDVDRQMEERKGHNGVFFEKMTDTLQKLIKDHEIKARVDARLKGHHSIYRKMKRKNRSLDGIYDYYAFRIHCDSVTNCYRILGLLHQGWRHIPGRIKDFIATPKENLYQSLHTTLISQEGGLFEVQVRTHSMHRIAEEGVAAYWSFEEGALAPKVRDQITAMFRRFAEEHRAIKDNEEYVRQLKGSLKEKNILVFTPQSEKKSLPPGSTVLDFAYTIHTDVGHQAIGARINGEKASLRNKLKSGDIIEIDTDASQSPDESWLKIAKTSSALQRIRARLRKDKRRRMLELGKTMFEREALKYGRLLIMPSKEQIQGKISEFGLRKLHDFWRAIALGEIPPHRAILPFLSEDAKQEMKESRFRRAIQSLTALNRKQIIVRGSRDALFPLASCCRPIIGDAIVGLVVKGEGVVVHREECKNLEDAHPGRLVDIRWDSPQEHRLFEVGLRMTVHDIEGMLAQISQAIASTQTNISRLHAGQSDDNLSIIEVTVHIHTPGQLDKIITRLQKIEDLLDVERV